jgi:hypothetical protein
MQFENVARKKESVRGGGVCIYCFSTNGTRKLTDEHTIPFSLGGSTQLAEASCDKCAKITSYLDGYLANKTFGHMRVHLNLQSRSGHAELLPAVIQLKGGERAIDFATKDHPYFLNLPLLRPPGILRGGAPGEELRLMNEFTYWYVPKSLAPALGVEDSDVAQVINSAGKPNVYTFARGLAKIAYCNAILRHGLDGFRRLVTPDIILGKYGDVAFFVGSDPTLPAPPNPPGQQHSVELGEAAYRGMKLLFAKIRLFADSAAGDRGMPYYVVVYGAPGMQKVVSTPFIAGLPRVIEL